MKFEKFGAEKENVTIKTKPMNFADNNIFKHFNNVFDYIKKNKPEILQEYIEKMTKGMQDITKIVFFNEKEESLINLLKKYEYITDYYQLFQTIMNFYLSTLGISKEEFWENKEQSFPDWNFFHSIRNIHLVSIKVMIEILGKEEGIELYKKIGENYVFKYDLNQQNIYKDLDELRYHHTRFITNNTLGRVRLISDVENGRYIEICLTCDKVRNFDNLSHEDFKLLDPTGCYIHHALTKLWNENFVLTLDQTLAKGDPYCSYVYHDTRIVDSIEHPPKEFFEDIISKIVK